MEQALLRQWEKIGKVPARAGTTAVVKKTAGGGFLWWRGVVGKGRGEGGGGVKERGRRERLPAGASTAAAVRKFRKRSCGSRHCWGSEEIRVALLRGAFTTAAVRKYR